MRCSGSTESKPLDCVPTFLLSALRGLYLIYHILKVKRGILNQINKNLMNFDIHTNYINEYVYFMI